MEDEVTITIIEPEDVVPEKLAYDGATTYLIYIC